MDLNGRVAELARSLAEGRAGSLLAARLRFDVDGATGDRDAALAWLAGAPRAAVAFTVVGMKRNLTFVDWVWPGVGSGVAVLSWDQDGNVAHAMVQLRSRGRAYADKPAN